MKGGILLTGQRFGRLAVLRQATSQGRCTRWECLCDCGQTTVVSAGNLRNGDTKSCGCLRREWRPEPVDYTGHRFGRLVVTGPAAPAKDGRVRCMCVCDCGGTCAVRIATLLSGETRSCGCLRREMMVVRGSLPHSHCLHGETVGGRPTKEYAAWASAKHRCFSPKCAAYRHYGGRGITMCSEWAGSYEAFLRDVGRAPSPKHSIDRINNNGNYEPGNVRWATASEQNKNRRRSGWFRALEDPVPRAA